uniref:Uncharacterized protein n=1 Tax=Opuntia streptacantha TaxID=393608 RepID=A0A7C9ECY7_OPUST
MPLPLRITILNVRTAARSSSDLAECERYPSCGPPDNIVFHIINLLKVKITRVNLSNRVSHRLCGFSTFLSHNTTADRIDESLLHYDNVSGWLEGGAKRLLVAQKEGYSSQR